MAKSKGTQRKITDFDKNIVAALHLQQKLAPELAPIAQLFNIVDRFTNYLASPSNYWSFFSSTTEAEENVTVDEDKLIADRMVELEVLCKTELSHIDTIDEALKNTSLDKTEQRKLNVKKRAHFSKVDELYLSKVELIPELVREHARRRVDLFFYLLIAVYKKNLYFDSSAKKGTDKQHGQGSGDRGTAGCHSSLITNVRSARKIDVESNEQQQSLLAKITELFQKNINLSSGEASTLLDELYCFEDFLEEYDEDVTADCESFLDNTHFAEKLNETVELPKIVNNFDSILETGSNKITTRACLGILNLVSRGECTPLYGMQLFARVMNLCFKALEYYYAVIKRKKSSSSVTNYPKSFSLVRQLEYEGTFSAFDERTLQLLPEYVDLHLQITRLPTAELIEASVLPRVLERIFLEKQEEILVSSPLEIKKPAK